MSTTKTTKPVVRKQVAEEKVEEPVEETNEEKTVIKGRKKKYVSDEERKIARRIQQREYRIRKAQELEKLRKLYNKDQKAKKDEEDAIVEEQEPVVEENQE